MTILTNQYLELSFGSDSGSGDGSTVDFITTQDLKSQTLIWVTVDGLNQTLNVHYSVNLSQNKITFVTAPATGQVINIKYAIK